MTWSLEMSTIYSHANNVITSMLPYAYLAGGLSLGFIAVNKIVSSFR